MMIQWGCWRMERRVWIFMSDISEYEDSIMNYDSNHDNEEGMRNGDIRYAVAHIWRDCSMIDLFIASYFMHAMHAFVDILEDKREMEEGDGYAPCT